MSEPRVIGDYYAVLGVAQDASADEIKKAFRNLARRYHPDVAGSEPETVENFKRIKRAYDVLGDAEQRASYDRRRARAANRRKGRSRMPGGFYFWDQPDNEPDPEPSGSRYSRDRGNDMDLDDLFSDHGGFVDFGFGNRGNSRKNQGAYAGGAGAVQGADISLTVDVPWKVAQKGGTVTVTYTRNRRTDDGRGVVSYDEIYDLRVPPGTQHGETLRCQGWGHAGQGTGGDGDLVCDVRVVGGGAAGAGRGEGSWSGSSQSGSYSGGQSKGAGASGWGASSSKPSGGARSAGSRGDVEAPQVVPISVTEALLGGRVELDTGNGKVSLSLPPCTSGGARFRLRGKGPVGPDGLPGDLYIQLKVVTPPLLDEESRQLIERFAQINDYNPREG
ncbi:MAG: J domain-containing protein [Alphaproteobacteria bacterium]|nr:J domain-containing protein [Alphaproteobacteria bacterium]